MAPIPEMLDAEGTAMFLVMCQGRNVIILDPSQMDRLLDALAIAVESHLKECDNSNPRFCHAAAFANTIGEQLQNAHAICEKAGKEMIIDLSKIT